MDQKEAIEKTAQSVKEHLTEEQAQELLGHILRRTLEATCIMVDKGLTFEEMEDGVREGIKRKTETGGI